MDETEATNEFRFSWHNYFELKTKRRMLSQFELYVERELLPISEDTAEDRGFISRGYHPSDPDDDWPMEWAWTGSWTEDTFESEEDGIDAAFVELLEQWDIEFILEIVFDPSRNGPRELAEPAKTQGGL